MKTKITGLSGNETVYYAAKACNKYERSIILVSDTEAAVRFEDDLTYFTSKEIIVIREEIDDNITHDKIRLLRKFYENEELVLIIPVTEAIKKYPSPENYRKDILSISGGDELPPYDLREKLTNLGYAMKEMAESCGDISSRGDILDVFVAGDEYPTRIEFFGDNIDSIRQYEPDSQRSIKKLDKIRIVPAIFYKKDTYISVYLSEDDVVIICDPPRLRDKITKANEYEGIEDFGSFMKVKTDQIVYSSFDYSEKEGVKYDKVIPSNISRMSSFNGHLKLLVTEIKKLEKKGFQIHIVAPRKQLEGIRSYIQDNGIYGNLVYDDAYLSSGIISEEDKVCYITLHDIFPNFLNRRTRKKKKKKSDDISFTRFKKGDYVVHELYGIGIFDGIETVEKDGEKRDYLEIHYAGEAILSIPVDNADMVEKYIGGSDSKPKLTKISGKEWSRTRQKARKAIETIAQDLVKLYAEREAKEGYKFSKDDEWQKNFEQEFPYEETDDQLKAAEEIKEDMEKSVPMDRLLCGDVGYGKTEVASRAIFKCLNDGKQAVMLAPTTLLVNQHYENLSKRFSNYPFEIEMLSRFRTNSEQRNIIKKLEAGTIDFVIGTHRLLSDDIKFKDLGLLVIDEEQRFGVRAKEKIKGLRKNIDVLTLSATPIPRTLNMSLTGIKNISTIEEPPEDRYPVQTYVSEENDEIIAKAIRRELERGGQTFVIYNRVNGISRIAKKIKNLIPEGRIAIGHGKMDEKHLEDVMKSFIDGKYDILVSTTIIENGIDISNANTIIILNAERLGMAQLYQLRGRVGRSNRIAYAYLMHKPDKVLTDEARKRLSAIKEFTEFGSGFKLAMRDLEIRGAGNVLGEAQSGHVSGIGYELYCKEIDRAVKKLQGNKSNEKKTEVNIEIGINGRIPKSYIMDESMRLQAYKKIAGIDSSEKAKDLIDELTDRFGEMPMMTINLINTAEIKSIAEKLGISRISKKMNMVDMELSSNKTIDPCSLIIAKENYKDRLIIKSGDTTVLRLYVEQGRSVQNVLSLLRSLKQVDI